MQCSISECRRKAARTIQIGFRETRNLCAEHLRLFEGRDAEHPVEIARASDIWQSLTHSTTRHEYGSQKGEKASKGKESGQKDPIKDRV
ncbi:MAG: hypothetical protein EB829_00700 [Nitrosopumilus sp. H8]|nr:MAG: hypothetical protein EB830_03990 [Nitrosopumilus sp. H13]RNJ80167.1 MAG: hypothetical protein EB829_00700 [Nitrosopumilus sp. H8]